MTYVRFTHCSTQVSKDFAFSELRRGAYEQGMDHNELTAIFARALRDTEDGEYARDELTSVNDCIEIYVR